MDAIKYQVFQTVREGKSICPLLSSTISRHISRHIHHVLLNYLTFSNCALRIDQMHHLIGLERECLFTKVLTIFSTRSYAKAFFASTAHSPSLHTNVLTPQ